MHDQEPTELFPCLFTLCFSVLWQLTVFRACVEASCPKVRKRRLWNCRGVWAPQRKAFAEGFGVSLGNWLLRQIDLNFAVFGTKELESGEPANKLNVLLGRAASTTTETGSRLFIHGGSRDSTFCPPCFIGAAMFPGRGRPVLIHLHLSPPSYPGKPSNLFHFVGWEGKTLWRQSLLSPCTWCW